jgi:hypothetical protein
MTSIRHVLKITFSTFSIESKNFLKYDLNFVVDSGQKVRKGYCAANFLALLNLLKGKV